MAIKIGDNVVYKENKIVRTVLDINSKGEVKAWGMGAYARAEAFTKLEEREMLEQIIRNFLGGK